MTSRKRSETDPDSAHIHSEQFDPVPHKREREPIKESTSRSTTSATRSPY